MKNERLQVTLYEHNTVLAVLTVGGSDSTIALGTETVFMGALPMNGILRTENLASCGAVDVAGGREAENFAADSTALASSDSCEREVRITDFL